MKLKMPMPWVPLPQMAIASPPPAAEPTRPIAIVSQTGIGSGPGTARRARLPVMNPNSMIMRMEPNTCPIEFRAHQAALLQRAGLTAARAELARPLIGRRQVGASESLGRCLRRGRDELAAQILDLVTELRGVLEAQLLRRREHLLLELDDQLLELGRRHALD